jgi:hypothetical protein
MEVDAWSEWAVPAGPGGLDGLDELIVTRAARLAGTGDALLWLAGQSWRAAGPLAATGL